jgi:glycerol uptake facilitator-like aquaporin
MTKLIVELLGSFLLSFTAGLTYLNMYNSSYAPLTIGGMLIVIILIGHKISGAHFNPAISLAESISGRLSLNQLINYILAQFLGASLAMFPVSYLTSSQTMQISASSSPKIFLAEFIFTLLLCISFLSFSSTKKRNGLICLSLSSGLVYAIAIILIGELSKSVLNPSLGFTFLIFRIIPNSLIPEYLSAHILAALIGGLSIKFFLGYEIDAAKDND